MAFTLGIVQPNYTMATVTPHFETEDLSKYGLVVKNTKYKLACMDYEHNFKLSNIEYYDNPKEAVKRYYNHRAPNFGFIMKIVTCEDANGNTVVKKYKWHHFKFCFTKHPDCKVYGD